MNPSPPPQRWNEYFKDFIHSKWAWVFVACSLLFFVLAADIRYRGLIYRWDQTLTNYFHELKTHEIFFFSWVTEFGGGSARKLLWILLVPLFFSKRWYHAPGLLIAVLLGAEINSRMQGFWGRPRPGFDDLPPLTHPGFPSGHTANACFLYGYSALILWREFATTKAFKITVATIAAALILAVGVSRMALLVHYTADVVGSYLWCTAWMILCYWVNREAFKASANRLNTWTKT